MNSSGVKRRLRLLMAVGFDSKRRLVASLPALRELTTSNRASISHVSYIDGLLDCYADWWPGPGAFIDLFDDCARVNPRNKTSVKIDNHEIAARTIEPRLRGAHCMRGTVAVSDGNAYVVCLYRDRVTEPFTAHDASEFLWALNLLGRERASLRLASGKQMASGDKAVCLVGATGRVPFATHRGRSLLTYASGLAITPATMREAEDTIRTSLDRIWRRVVTMATCGRPQGALACGRFKSAWADFLVEAFSPLDIAFEGADLVPIVIQRQRHLIERVISGLSSKPLSSQQSTIALYLTCGMTVREVAGATGLSVNTVSYHVKAVYSKLQVHDKSELREALLSDPHTSEVDMGG